MLVGSHDVLDWKWCKLWEVWIFEEKWRKYSGFSSGLNGLYGDVLRSAFIRVEI